jgi:WD40 repeat protein
MPRVQDTLERATSALEACRKHPAAEAAEAAAHEAVVAAAAAAEAAMSHPHLQAALTHPVVHAATSDPRVVELRAHVAPFTPAFLGALGGLLLVGLLRLLGCVCGCLFGRPRAPFRKTAGTDGSEGGGRKQPAKGAAKHGKERGKTRLIGAGEGALRTDEPPSALGSAVAPIVAATHALLRLNPFVGGGGNGQHHSLDRTNSARARRDGGGSPPLTPTAASTPGEWGSPSEVDDWGSPAGLSPVAHVERARGARGKHSARTPPSAHHPAGGGRQQQQQQQPASDHPRLRATLKGFKEPVLSASLSPDGNLAAAVSVDRTLRVFSGLTKAVTQKQPLATPLIANVPDEHATCCALSANGRNVIVATATSRRLRAYTITPPGTKSAKAGVVLRKEFPPRGEPPAHTAPMCAALLAPNSKFVLTVGSEEDRDVKMWSLAGALIAKATNSKLAAQFGASISADSRLIAIAAAASTNGRPISPKHGQVTIFEVAYEGEEPVGLASVMCVSGHTQGVNDVSFASDCVHLALASNDGEWSVWKTDVRYDLRQDAKEHARGIAPTLTPFERVALSPFARRLIGASASQLAIIDVSAAALGGSALLEVLHTGHAGIGALAFSGDGLCALSGGDDGKLRLWEVEDSDKAGTI